MAVFTGHTCNATGFRGSLSKEERQRDCPACQRLPKTAGLHGKEEITIMRRFTLIHGDNEEVGPLRTAAAALIEASAIHAETGRPVLIVRVDEGKSGAPSFASSRHTKFFEYPPQSVPALRNLLEAE